jgi:hypothetical protein
MLDLLPLWIDEYLSRMCNPVSRAVSRMRGGPDMPLCAQVREPWRTIIGRRHCEASREDQNG